MNIAGIQKTTLLDYPGKVATTIFTAGCNFRCGFCHNPEQVIPELIAQESKHFIPEEVFFNFLEKRKDVLDAVVICGGEPTLQPDLYSFAKKIKEDYGLLIKLDTNGQDVDIVRKMIDTKLIDAVAMDIKTSFSKYAELAGVNLQDSYFESHKELVKLLIESDLWYEFRTTVSKGFHTAQDIQEIVESLTGAQRYAIQNFKPGKTIDPNFSGQSFTAEELAEFAQIAQKTIPHVIVRN